MKISGGEEHVQHRLTIFAGRSGIFLREPLNRAVIQLQFKKKKFLESGFLRGFYAMFLRWIVVFAIPHVL